MLTKQEREEIAGRLKKCTCMIADSAYKALFNKEVPSWTTWQQDSNDAINRILDLCDTSNMIELPLDKDGEVIKVGDTVYVDDDVKYKVVGYMMRGNGTEVILAAGAEPVYTKEPANKLTHKKTVTVASLVGEIRRTLSQNTTMNKETTAKLWEITDQIEMLGDSND